MKINTRVMLITGAAGGIGSAVAAKASQAGYLIVLAYNSSLAAAAILQDAIKQNGGSCLLLKADLSKPEECGRLIDDAAEHYGRVDVLVNNAGFLHQQPFENIPADEFDFTFAVNLRAPFLLAQAVFPHMKKQGGGHIINIASSGGQLGGPLAPHYAASKAGLICLTKSLARLGAPHNIITHAVSPGLIVTDMSNDEMQSEAGREKLKTIPLGRPGSVHDVAEMVLFAASGKMDYATGQTTNLNGGLYMG